MVPMTHDVPEFTRARAESIRYHQELYSSADLGMPGTWLASPHRLVQSAVELITEPVHAYDLGAGVGRHAILLAQELPAGSQITAVDLLPEAIDMLQANAEAAGVADLIEGTTADLATYRFPKRGTGLVVAFSTFEHLPSLPDLHTVLDRATSATASGGVHVVAFFADRREVTPDGPREALIELSLTEEEAVEAFDAAYEGWEILTREVTPTEVFVHEAENYTLEGTLVAYIARKP